MKIIGPRFSEYEEHSCTVMCYTPKSKIKAIYYSIDQGKILIILTVLNFITVNALL